MLINKKGLPEKLRKNRKKPDQSKNKNRSREKAREKSKGKEQGKSKNKAREKSKGEKEGEKASPETEKSPEDFFDPASELDKPSRIIHDPGSFQISSTGVHKPVRPAPVQV